MAQHLDYAVTYQISGDLWQRELFATAKGAQDFLKNATANGAFFGYVSRFEVIDLIDFLNAEDPTLVKPMCWQENYNRGLEAAHAKACS